MTEEQELWACAIEVERQHGAKAPAFVAARIGDLALKGDVNGINRWKGSVRPNAPLVRG